MYFVDGQPTTVTVNSDPLVYAQVRKVRDMRVVATDKALNKRCPTLWPVPGRRGSMPWPNRSTVCTGISVFARLSSRPPLLHLCAYGECRGVKCVCRTWCVGLPGATSTVELTRFP